jgi:hypothetical protein
MSHWQRREIAGRFRSAQNCTLKAISLEGKLRMQRANTDILAAPE